MKIGSLKNLLVCFMREWKRSNFLANNLRYKVWKLNNLKLI